ncbi:MAG: CYTH domain-containing protein [Deltaproteobacteria bacterium]|nr:CYTH domain-containing protein [Deltaproteobacteria bacterium]
MNIEFESTLVVCSSDPQAVFDRLAARESIGTHRVIVQPPVLIRDRYFDTPEKILLRKGIALRLRDEGSRQLICLKCDERILEWGAAKRVEIEEPWSRSCLINILNVLEQKSVALTHVPRETDEPCNTLKALNMIVIQERETHRQLRQIVPIGEIHAPVVAEMMLDTVLYRIGSGTIQHYELEIEAAQQKDEKFLQTLIEDTLRSFPVELKRWDHNKLITGLAIEMLWADGLFPEIKEKQSRLNPDSYDRIDVFLRQSNCLI